ncbi:MAG: S1 RNA-binding domain-containing protein, partial [Anaerolineales bacterium]|nr:S1 RNA-binding domain-containing protein [Anaerolineales bacterium]
SGKVVRLEKFGAFIDIGAERPGLVHVREITTGRVAHPDEVVTLGEEVEAQVIGVNRKKRQIDLSMRALEQQVVDESEDEAPPATVMELALRAAMEGQFQPERSTRKKRKNKGSNTQEKLLRRTLENRRDE